MVHRCEDGSTSNENKISDGYWERVPIEMEGFNHWKTLSWPSVRRIAWLGLSDMIEKFVELIEEPLRRGVF